MPFPKAIITKPILVSDSEYKDLGLNINLVGYDSFSQVAENTKQHASPRLLNWVEPYEISGVRKTLFYTEVNTNFQVGDRVYIVNGNYDNDNLIKKDKYKKGRDGYKVLKMEQCKIVLDIDYTGVLPYNDDSLDDYIKVYYIDNLETFVSANRQVTTRGGNFDYKFNYYQNNIAFIDRNFPGTNGWGLNGGVSGAPGFFVREGKEGWSKISDEFVYLGSFSVALSPTYGNNGKVMVMDGNFTYNGIQFKEGFVYKWETGPTSSSWVVDSACSPAIITKSNFRNGTFNGKFNNGLYGTQKSKLDWTGKGTWNGGSMLNTLWKSGTIDSKLNFTNTYRAAFDEYGIPFQKSYTNNNGGFGFNYIFDSEIKKSLVSNGNFYNTTFDQSATFSVVENHVLSITQSFDNRIIKANFELCNFSNIQIEGGELKNVRIKNSKVTNVKSINSYFENSVLKDSTYVSDKIIKILGYDEWNMSEYLTTLSGQYSSIKDVNSKIYKFYISKESFKRMKTEDVFYIKGLKIKNSPTLTNFFDNKFRLTSWTEFYDDINSTMNNNSIEYFFYKRGYECSAFLSTPEENAYVINSYESLLQISGATVSKYTTTLSGKNSKAAYSIDIVVSRHDLYNKNRSIDTTSEWDSMNPKNFNYDSDVIAGTTSLPTYLGDNIDINSAYILDSNFESGIVETSDWNSGYHVNYNKDVVITSITSSGVYELEIDDQNDYLIANTGLDFSYPEKIGKYVISKGDVVFLNSIDYDTRGMVDKVTLLTGGSSYSSSTDPMFLTNTKIGSLTMSSVGTNYITGNDLTTISNGNGTGLTLDITANPIGSVISITYSAPITNGGSYSINLVSSVSTNTGPIATSFSTDFSFIPPSYTAAILTDDAQGTVTGITAVQNGGANATYSVFGPPQTKLASGATGVGTIFVTGPFSVSSTGVTSSPISLGSGLTLNYRTSTNGAITYLEVNNKGTGYDVGQIFRVEGGNATFSITSIGKGEITSYSIKNPGEDYLTGEVLDIVKPFDPNFQFGDGTTASVVVTSITVSNVDTKGLSFDVTANPAGNITNISIKSAGLYYNVGEIFAINSGNLDSLVRVDSVTGSVVRLNDTYKVVENSRGIIKLQDLGTKNIIAGLTANGKFYTTEANNRWGYISKTKIDRTKIKSGIFKRSYITNSLIRDVDYDSNDRNFANNDKIKNIVISDSLFSNNSNILSSATYLYSTFVGGSDIWNDGIIYKSVVNGMTFSKGTVRTSTWLNGAFTGGVFYSSNSFDAKPTLDRPNYLSNRVKSYYFTGEFGATFSNNRYSWRNGVFKGGEFYKSDWENGVMEGGLFYYSKFYNGTINGGKVGTRRVAANDTRVYNGLINYTTVDNARVYSEDTSYTGLSSSSIVWRDGIFNDGVFGSNNDNIMGTTVSNVSYSTPLGSLPIADFKITTIVQAATATEPILGNFEIDSIISLKHTYLGDLVINLMAPNGKIINVKKRYSCGSNDNLTSTIFTSDTSKPNLEVGTSPYTGEFKFDAKLNEGVYYDMSNRLLPSIAYQADEIERPPVIDYRSFPPTNFYEGDRYLVIATSSDPNWTTSVTNAWPSTFVDRIVEKSTGTTPELYIPKKNEKIFVKNKSEYLKYIESSSFTGWTKSYHSNTSSILNLLNDDKTITGNWKLLIMDCAAIDSGFVEDFKLQFNYKTSYIIKTFKNDAVWYNGIFNGGQFVDLGVWKNGKFNGGKFISTYGHEKSGNYLYPSDNVIDYSWQAGEFNGGEFGNESLLSNSTWFNGEFNGGVFKGKLWNNGIFAYGEFKGGASLPAVGGGIKSVNAQAFVETFKGDYYGVWRGGIVSDKKDNFVTDKKIFTPLERATKSVKLGNTAKFSNILWMSGTFDHPSGEMKNSVWMNGLFKMGTFKSSAFNPYVKRKSDIQEFVKDDSCIWENGKFVDSEFHMSKWKYGQFISGTAVGMIWKNGISNYMNAYNIFWENGVWRNGNWFGSQFEYRGKVEDGFAKEILNRGIEWSGTSSCHIWNIFETDADTTKNMVTSEITKNAVAGSVGGDSFTTTNVDDLGYEKPRIGSLTVVINSASQITCTFPILSNGGSPIKEYGVIFNTSTSQAAANTSFPAMVVGNTEGYQLTSATSIRKNQSPTYVAGDATTGYQPGTATVVITGLSTGNWYSIQGYALNNECNFPQNGPSLTNTVVTLTVQKNNVTTNPLPTTLQSNGEIYTGSNNVYVQAVKAPITIVSTYETSSSMPAPTETGIVYKVVPKGDPAPIDPVKLPGSGGNDNVILSSSTSAQNFTSVIPLASVQGNHDYYIKSYTVNTGGIGHGPLIKVTSGVIAPTVAITADATTLTGNLSNTGGSTTLQRGFIISKTNNIATSTQPSTISTTVAPTGIYRLSIDTGAVGNFTKLISSITGLNGGDTYYVKAYSYNESYPTVWTYSGSSALTFTAPANAPGAITNLAPTPISTTGATLKATLGSSGGASITARGFVYTTNAAYTYPSDPSSIITNSATLGNVVGSGTSPMTGAVTGLTEGQKYYFKAYATNSAGTTYADTAYEFYTLGSLAIVSFASTDTTITPSMTLTSATTPTATGIIWSTTTSGLTLPNNNKTTSISDPATGLTPNTKYYLVGYTTNAGNGTYYTTPASEKLTIPAFESTTSTNVTESSTSVSILTNLGGSNGNVIKGQSANITAKGIAWGTSTTPTTLAPATSLTTLAQYTTNISPLVPGTLYYYRPYATNSAGTGYGTEAQFTTLATVTLPTITTNISYTGDTITIGVSGDEIDIVNTGGQSITEYGLCFKTGTNAIPTDQTGATPFSSGPITATTTSFVGTLALTPASSGNIIYNIRVYAKNAGGTAYSSTIEITINAAGVQQGGISVSA